MTTHTPGPWEDGRSSDSIVWKGYKPKDDLAESLIEWYGGQLIAESIAPHNKSLIKAAPDMLAALEMVESLLIGVAMTDYPVTAELEKVTAIIAKAKGQAHE